MALTLALLTLLAFDPLPLEQTPWTLRSLTLPGQETFRLGPHLPRPTLRLGPTRFAGHTGCNAISGQATWDGDHLTLQVQRQTSLPCPDHLLSLEADFLRLLQGPLRPDLQGHTLTLSGEERGRLVFGAPGFSSSGPDVLTPEAGRGD